MRQHALWMIGRDNDRERLTRGDDLGSGLPTASNQALVTEEQTLTEPVSPMLEPAQQCQDWYLGSSGQCTITVSLTYFMSRFPRRQLFSLGLRSIIPYKQFGAYQAKGTEPCNDKDSHHICASVTPKCTHLSPFPVIRAIAPCHAYARAQNPSDDSETGFFLLPRGSRRPTALRCTRSSRLLSIHRVPHERCSQRSVLISHTHSTPWRSIHNPMLFFSDLTQPVKTLFDAVSWLFPHLLQFVGRAAHIPQCCDRFGRFAKHDKAACNG